MTKQVLFWSGILTAISFWLGWSLRLEADPVGEMAIVLPLVSVVMLVSCIWFYASAKHKNSARGFPAIALSPALMSIIMLSTAKFLPAYFDLSSIIAMHLMVIVTGNYMTTSTTWVSGFPTIWNVKSPSLWSKSQRFFGYGTVIFGVVSLIACLITGTMYRPVAFGGLIVLFILGNIHSFLLWKKSQT